MKTIQLIDTDVVKGRDVLKVVMEQAGPSGANIEQIRKRCKILDALDAAKNGLLNLEDADFDFVCSTVKAFQFGAANRELLKVVDGLITEYVLQEEKKS